MHRRDSSLEFKLREEHGNQKTPLAGANSTRIAALPFGRQQLLRRIRYKFLH